MMDDYVLRKSVYDALCKICSDRGACEHTGQEGCHRVFSEIPAADVRENVHGEWVDDERRPMSDPRLQCSNCGSIEMPLVKWNYCPVCGADMRGSSDGKS